MTFAELVEQFLLLRLQVAYAGETSAPAWWPTSCLTADAALDFKHLFADAAPAVAWQLSSQAACQAHDKWLSGMDYHLFRLPEGLEEAIYHTGLQLPVAHAQQWLEEKEALWTATKSADPASGPQRLGSSADLLSGAALPALRACYGAAFQGGVQVFPYFTTV
ncbi:BrxE family protein [Hymenobacter sp. BT664]|uniref:BrxE family protein n=1 Tax=Hymenobacter montanus TaxID=2771359 RepID=A0A927GKQ3_9BACT|nr:BrxE family protein [Hymenobacter montanus]MBD2769376.1 BrxE family protein [Hymenobacter montanus]